MKSFKTITIFLLFFSLLSSCKNKSGEDEISNIYDVVIAGAGLSGLSAGYHLRNKNILILEKDSRAGGRIYDKTYKNVTYSMGAHIGYNSLMTPKELTGKIEIKKLNTPRGISVDGKLYLGKTTLDAVFSLLSEKEKASFLKYRKGLIKFNEFLKNFEDIDKIGGEFAVLNESYEDDPNLGYLMDEYYDNFDLVGYYCSVLGDKIQLLSKVISVRSLNDKVEIVYIQNGEGKKVYAKSAIVATPANASVKILKDLPEKTFRFLSEIQYRGYEQVTLIFKSSDNFIPFPYLQVLNNDLFLIYRHTIHDGAYVFYSLYYNKGYFINHSKNIVDISLEKLNSLKIGDFSRKELFHHDIIIWDDLFSTVSSEVYEKYWDESILNPLKGVFLAGDYTMGGKTTSELTSRMLKKSVKNDGMPGYEFVPYGVFQAWLSGVGSAEKAGRYLENGNN